MGRLDELDLSLSLSKSDYKERLDAAQTRFSQLRLALGGKLLGYEGRLGPALAGAFEGWDASGKGGALKRQVEPLDPLTLVTTAAVIFGLALLVSLRPAFEATRVDLNRTLREE